jgi:competence protein ComEA
VPDLGRSQLLVYGAVAVTLLLVGARWIRGGDAAGSAAGGASYASAGGPGGGAGSGTSFSVSDEGEDVVVHVAGEVRHPGVYRLPAGSRVTDAVERAGGGTADADLDTINLAARLADGQQVVMPAAAAAPGGAMQGPSSAVAPDGPISLGSATLEQLDTIEGIGPVTAQSILDFRDQHGGLSSVDELDQVDGIGPATLDALRARLQP